MPSNAARSIRKVLLNTGSNRGKADERGWLHAKKARWE